MKKIPALFSLIILLAVCIKADAQGTLQFSQVIIVGSTLQTVPSGKVWKAEAIFGEQINACMPVDCFASSYYAKGIATGMYVNGMLIPSSIRGYKSSHTLYTDNICTSSAGGGYDLTCANKAPDPNILPMWLPAGTTLKSLGTTSFISVVEFNVIP
ncbi:MAG: hypothetical protein WCM76_08015 [Bacteroidota bacterium]